MDQLFQNTQLLSSVNYANFSLGLVLLIIYTLVFQVLFRNYALVTSNRTLFSSNFLFFSISIYLIITTIKSSLALSLGLVGALSIIRFRTAIKEPEQIIFLLGLTAISISLAAEQFIISTLCVVVFGLVSVFRYKGAVKSERLHSDFLLVSFTESTTEKAENCISKISAIQSVTALSNYEFSNRENYRLLFKLQDANIQTVSEVNKILAELQVQNTLVKISTSNA